MCIGTDVISSWKGDMNMSRACYAIQTSHHLYFIFHYQCPVVDRVRLLLECGRLKEATSCLHQLLDVKNPRGLEMTLTDRNRLNSIALPCFLYELMTTGSGSQSLQLKAKFKWGIKNFASIWCTLMTLLIWIHLQRFPPENFHLQQELRLGASGTFPSRRRSHRFCCGKLYAWRVFQGALRIMLWFSFLIQGRGLVKEAITLLLKDDTPQSLSAEVVNWMENPPLKPPWSSDQAYVGQWCKFVVNSPWLIMKSFPPVWYGIHISHQQISSFVFWWPLSYLTFTSSPLTLAWSWEVIWCPFLMWWVRRTLCI